MNIQITELATPFLALNSFIPLFIWIFSFCLMFCFYYMFNKCECGSLYHTKQEFWKMWASIAFICLISSILMILQIKFNIIVLT